MIGGNRTRGRIGTSASADRFQTTKLAGIAVITQAAATAPVRPRMPPATSAVAAAVRTTRPKARSAPRISSCSWGSTPLPPSVNSATAHGRPQATVRSR